jgi:hypothetical protein
VLQSARVRVAAAALLGAVVLAHCVWMFAIGVRVVRLLLTSPPAEGRIWSGLAEAAAVAAAAWVGVALAGVGALAVWLRVQRVRP